MSTKVTMKSNTINKQEIKKFSQMASEWWDPEGKFAPLHKFNPIRIKYIKDSISKHFNIENNKIKPLKNLDILDIGCGGGLLSEPMSRLGANVTGIDASQKNINIAKVHSLKNKLKINYICASPENFKSKKKYDIILNMEIIEHVEDVNFFIKKSAGFLKKNGLMFVATLNKTLKSYVFAIIGAEYILRWLPIGTHDWNKFVDPFKLIEYGKNNSLKVKRIDGIKFNPILGKWDLSKDKSVNYISQFVKF
tara:strand:- start:324 stop:1073 length:750 start_codon:yes stop_codon:yes gene_type:complete